MKTIPLLTGSILALLCSCQDSSKRDAFEAQASSEIEDLNEQVRQLSDELKTAVSSLEKVEANSLPADKAMPLLQQYSAENKDLGEALRGLASRQMASEEAIFKLAQSIQVLDKKVSDDIFAEETQSAAKTEQRNQQINLIRERIGNLQVREKEIATKLANAPKLELRIGDTVRESQKWLKEDMELHERLYGPLKREYAGIQNQIAQQTALLNDLLIQP